VNLALHALTTPEPVNVPLKSIGPIGVGAPNETLNQRPPIKPMPEDEQGVGRHTPLNWEHQEHLIHDNEHWYLGHGELYDPAYDAPGQGPLQTPIPIAQLLSLQYYENWQAQSTPGGAGMIATIPAPIPLTQTDRSLQ
jgi:hypothetical protein